MTTCLAGRGPVRARRGGREGSGGWGAPGPARARVQSGRGRLCACDVDGGGEWVRRVRDAAAVGVVMS